MPNILVYALHYDGAINKNSLGAVSEGAKLAAELGGEAHAILLGENVPQDLAASLGKYGAKKVLVARAPRGSQQPLVDAMARGNSRAAITPTRCSAAACSAFEIGAGLAARLRRGRRDGGHERGAPRGGELIAERPILGDSSISEVKYRSDVGIVIGRLNAFEIVESGTGAAAVEQLSFEVGARQAKQANDAHARETARRRRRHRGRRHPRRRGRGLGQGRGL